MKIKTLAVLIAIFFVSHNFSFAQMPSHPQVYCCNKANVPIIIDGVINEHEWDQAIWTQNFCDITDSKIICPIDTKVKMLWDSTYLYIAAYMQEPHLWSKIDKDESIIYLENDFEVFIDPDGDNHLYAEYEFNALNTKWDLLLNRPYRDRGIPIFGWNSIGLKHAVHLEGSLNDPSDLDSCWTIEIAIPLQDIEDLVQKKAATVSGSVWRINFSRVQWETEAINGEYVKQKRPEHNWVWSPQWTINMHQPEYWGYLYFLDDDISNEKLNTIDTHWEEKMILMSVYESQKKYKYNHGCFASEISQLSLPMWTYKSEIEMQASCELFLVKGENYQVNYLGKLWEK